MSSGKQNAPSTREMERINWIEFRDWVPTQIQTVLLPLGTLEPHGVAPNGTDIQATVAIARGVAPRVNAMIAPVSTYRCTGILRESPCGFSVPEGIFTSYVGAVRVGWTCA